MGIKEDLTRTEFYNRENTQNHLPYDREIAFYQSIKNGDMEEMKRLFEPLGVAGYGKLSGNNLRNHKYHLIITVAFITRYCIEGGLEMETAYNLSDLYIRKIDTCTSLEELDELHVALTEDYVKRMRTCKNSRHYSRPISRCIDYIYDNLHCKIQTDDLAREAELSKTYLSKLFHKETGKTIVQYIMEKKLDAAKNLLMFTEHSTTEIANYLNFSSESHFISAFKKSTGLTPKKFKQYNFRQMPRSL